MQTHDTLRGGTVARLNKWRRYRDDWNAKADSGDRRYSMRTRLDAGLAGVLKARSHHSSFLGQTGDNVGEQLATAGKEKRGYFSAPWSLVDGWRDVGNVTDILPHYSRAYPGNYSSDDHDGVYSGHVWQLPARDGSPFYVAGYIEREGYDGDGRQGGYVVLACNYGPKLCRFDDKEDAAKAADGLAEAMAREAFEYSQRWREAQQADSERDEARKELKEAREFARLTVAALRELPPLDAAHVDAFSVTRARLRESLHGFLDDMRAAIEKIETCRDKIADLDMTGEF